MIKIINIANKLLQNLIRETQDKKIKWSIGDEQTYSIVFSELVGSTHILNKVFYIKYKGVTINICSTNNVFFESTPTSNVTYVFVINNKCITFFDTHIMATLFHVLEFIQCKITKKANTSFDNIHLIEQNRYIENLIRI